MGVRIINVNAADQVFSNAGGGGSSDFTTATVYIEGIPAETFAYIYAGDENFPAGIYHGYVADGMTIPLYNGKQCIYLETTDNIQITGDANIETIDGFSYLVIEGDCTITYGQPT